MEYILPWCSFLLNVGTSIMYKDEQFYVELSNNNILLYKHYNFYVFMFF